MNDIEREMRTLLHSCAAEAARAVAVPGAGQALAQARRRRAAQTAAGAFALVAVAAIGIGATLRPQAAPLTPPGTAPPSTEAPWQRDLDDPVLRPLRTGVPALVWTPEAGRKPDDVSRQNEFRGAVFGALPGERDFSMGPDLGKSFPDASVAGPALLFDQAATRAQMDAAAAALSEVDGVADAHVILVPGMWFEVSVSRTYPSGSARQPIIDLAALPPGVLGSATGGNDREVSARVTYAGPGVTRAEYDRIVETMGRSVQLGPEDVKVTPLRIT